MGHLQNATQANKPYTKMVANLIRYKLVQKHKQIKKKIILKWK